MTAKEKVKIEIYNSINKVISIIDRLKDDISKDEKYSFQIEYQNWYSIALNIIENTAPKRYNEFKSYYEIDSKRKSLGYGTYVIQDYLKGVIPNSLKYTNFSPKKEVIKCIYNQYTILNSLYDHIDNILSDIQGNLFFELQDNEIETAKKMMKINLRSAGVITGVVLEVYLKRLVDHHKIGMTKKNPTLSDLNDLLKNKDIYDTPIWRKISYLTDVRNVCAHNKEEEPKKVQVEELIDGVQWIMKNVY